MKFASLLFIAAATLGGCAAYQKQPLDLKAAWPEGLSRLEVDPSKMPLPELSSRRFDPGDGLDMTEVAMIAVANNPGLKLARDDAGIKNAQAFAARLLPDPQLSFSPQFPQNGIPGENITAFDLGLSYNLGAIMTRSLRMAAAEKERRKADLALLWQEWQVVGQSRLLFARMVSRRNLLGILEESRAVAATRLDREKDALGRKDVTLNVVAMDENTLQQIDKQINETMRLLEKNRYALNDLLGLAPNTRLNLVGNANIPILDKSEIENRLSVIARIRPDLMALQARYKAQDLRLRQA
ncbi:MAG TPA: TolC family protein, partial [Burkholderiales bacterium]|nr:TolC family protein [Burkholderiales bacterium]